MSNSYHLALVGIWLEMVNAANNYFHVKIVVFLVQSGTWPTTACTVARKIILLLKLYHK